MQIYQYLNYSFRIKLFPTFEFLHAIMSKLDNIREPVKPEMKEFNRRFRKSISSSVPLLNLVTAYVLKRKGKQMRPLFVFLASKMTGSVTDSSYTAASLIELMHTATLVHDDVVDESNQRRGAYSINALWKAKIAVLFGDFLLAKGLVLAVQHKEYGLLEIISEASREMSEGELLQLQKSRSLNIDMDTYYEVIRKKTASLIAACISAGVKAAKGSHELVGQAHKLGVNIGMAFQIKDDLFDYQNNGSIGKPVGNDIMEKKFTLPLIYSLNQCNSGERKRMIRKIKSAKKNQKAVREVIAFVQDKGGVDFASAKMHEFKNEALQILEVFPDSPARKSMKDLVLYTVSREK